MGEKRILKNVGKPYVFFIFFFFVSSSEVSRITDPKYIYLHFNL